MMYGLGSTPGRAPAQPGDAGADEHGAEPQRHPRVEAALEQIEGQRARRDEEHEDPDRPVIESVIELVALADLALGRVLDGYGGHVCLFLGPLRAEYTPAARIRVSRSSAMPVATARLSESTPRAIGMRTRSSAADSAAGVRPCAFRANQQGQLRRRGREANVSSGSDGSRGVSATSLNPAARRPRQRGRPFVELNERHAQGRAHRCANGLPVERIAAGGTEHHDVGAERGRVAKHPADVVGIGDAFEHDGQTRIGQHGFQRERGRTLDERQTSAVDVMARDAEEVGRLAHENRDARGDGRECRLEIPPGRVAHEHRPQGPSSVFNQTSDDDPAFCDEKVPRSQECRLRDAAVVGDPRIVGGIDSIEHHTS